MESQRGLIYYLNEGYYSAEMVIEFVIHTGVIFEFRIKSGGVYHLPPTAHTIFISFVEIGLFSDEPIYIWDKCNNKWINEPHVFRYQALKSGKFLTRGVKGWGYVSSDECHAIPCRPRTQQDVENASSDPYFAKVQEELDEFLLVRYNTIATLNGLAEQLNRMNFHEDITTTATSTTGLVSAGLGIAGLIMMIPPVTPFGASLLIASATTGGAAGAVSLGNFLTSRSTQKTVEEHLKNVLENDQKAMEKFLSASDNFLSLSQTSSVTLDDQLSTTDILKKGGSAVSTAIIKPIVIAQNLEKLAKLEKFFKVTQAVEQGTMTLQQASAASKASRVLYEGEKLAAKGLGTFGQVIGWVGAIVTVPIEIYTLSTTIPKLMEGSPNEQAKKLLEIAKTYQEQTNVLHGN